MTATTTAPKKNDALDLRISPITVQAQTVERLRNAIVRQHFKPNQRLVEAELSKAMGVSRNLLREALRILEAEKLVTTIPNRGPSVTAISWEEAEEIYHVRALLEGEACALAATRLGPEEHARLKAALREFADADAAGDVDGRLTSTNAFYDVITRGCGNRIIRESLQNLTDRINFIRMRSMSKSGRTRHSLREMTAIYNAIRKKDPVAARAAAVEHVKAACEAARVVFRQDAE